MRKLYLLIMMSLPVWGFSQIYCSETDMYPDISSGPIWISNHGTVNIPTSGIYTFSISALNSSLTFNKITVSVGSTQVSLLQNGNSYSGGGTYFHNSGIYPFKVAVLTSGGTYAECAEQEIKIVMWKQDKVIDHYTARTTTKWPTEIRFKPTAQTVDHKGFWGHSTVVASNSIILSPGVNISPNVNPAYRKFMIRSCFGKRVRSTSEVSEQSESTDTEGLPSALHLISNPVRDEMHLELINSEEEVGYELYSMEGKKVNSGVLIPGRNNIPVHQLQNGLYFIKCNQGTHQYQIKVMVKH